VTTFTDDELAEVRRRFPAKYSEPILEQIALELRARLITAGTVLDPYAGIGGIHALRELLPGIDTLGVEIEEPFAACHPDTLWGDSRELAKRIGDRAGTVTAVVTSPDYGNRLADQYLGSPNEKCRRCSGTGTTMTAGDCGDCGGSGKAPSKRMGYAIALGRKCDPRSGARYQFGKKYRDLHLGILAAVCETIPAGTLLIYNVSSSIAEKGYRPVMEWWVTEIARRADIKALVPVETARLKFGANHDARVPAEHLIIARTPI
jgi:hypothetical protein